MSRLLLLLSLALVSVVWSVSAQPPSQVTLVVSVHPDAQIAEAVHRVEAELVLAGFRCEIVTAADDEDVRDGLESDAQRRGSLAAISIVRIRGRTAVDIWVADRVTGKTAVRRFDAIRDASNAKVLAIRAVELLRGSLQEIAWESPTATTSVSGGDRSVQAPPDVARWARRGRDLPAFDSSAEGDWNVVVGGVVLHQFSLATSAGPALGLGHRVASDVRARLEWWGPNLGNDFSGTAGDASLRQDVLTSEFLWIPGLKARPWAPMVMAGAGAHHLSVHGTGAPPYVGRSGARWFLAASAGVGFHLRVAPRISFELAARALWLMPRPEVAIAEVRRSAGEPSILGSLSLVVDM